MDPWDYDYPSPLKGWENQEPLSDEKNEDGKSLKNPTPVTKSSAYTSFPPPLLNDIRGGFDIHVYFLQSREEELKYATELHERIRREFPELRIYRLWDKPIGPHPVGMFEVNLFTPEQFGAFIPWLVINRGPLSALLHPNTGVGQQYRDHTQRACWLGTPYPVNAHPLKAFDEKDLKENATQVNGSWKT